MFTLQAVIACITKNIYLVVIVRRRVTVWT